MRLTPLQSQLEVESSSPESLAPATPVRNGDATKRRPCNDNALGRSALHLGHGVLDDLYGKLADAPSITDQVHNRDRPPSSPSVRSGPGAPKSRTNTMQDDCLREGRTLDDELLDFVEDPEIVRSIDIKMPPRQTLEPDVSIAMAVLNNELSPPLQPGDSGLIEPVTANKGTGNGEALPLANVRQQHNDPSAAQDVVEVLVEGEAAKDPYRAPSLTQLDTRLRSGLTKFVFLAPAWPGPIRGALVTRSSSSSQSSETGSNGDARCTKEHRSSFGRQDESEATKSRLRNESRKGAELHDPETGTVVRREAGLLVSPPSSSTGDTSATGEGEESARRVGTSDLAGTSSSAGVDPEDRGMFLQHDPSPEQPLVTVEQSPGNVACVSFSHPSTNVAQVAVVTEVIDAQAPWTMVDCACQADLMAWPCATPSCKNRSERSLANRHCLGQVERFEVLEKPDLSHSSTCVNPSGSPLCWACGFEHRRQVVRSRKQRVKARRHLKRLEVKVGSVSTAHEARDVSRKRKLEAGVLSEVLEPLAKRQTTIETVPCELLLTSPISYRLVQTDRTTPQLSSKTSQQANRPPAANRTPVLSKRSLPVEAQHTGKTYCAGTASSSTQTEERLQRTEQAVSSCSTPQTPSSRHASKTPSPLRAVQTVAESPPSSPPPLSPSAGRGTNGSGATYTLCQRRLPSPTKSTVVIEKCSTSVIAQAQPHHNNLSFPAPNASKHRQTDTEKQDPVQLHFCECGRDLARFAEKLPCKTCMNEQYWQLLAESEDGNAATRDDSADKIAYAYETPHSTELCFICSKLVAFDEHGLCIPCANPMVSKSRDAAKRQKRNKSRGAQGQEPRKAQLEQRVPSPATDLDVDVVVPAKQVKRKPLKSILKRR